MIFLRRGQSAIEFAILTAGVFFFFIMLLGIMESNIANKTREKNDQVLLNFATGIQQEIAFAYESTDGYTRTFELPEKMLGRGYNATISGETLAVWTLDNKYGLSLPVASVTGNLVQGENLITKQDGEIYLNP